MLFRNIGLRLFLIAALPWLAVACLGASPETPAPEVIPASVLVSSGEIFPVGDPVGDIDADYPANYPPENPAEQIKRFQPLADYLVDHLGLYGYQTGRVAVTKNMEDMADLLKGGTIDIYMDSPFPTRAGQELSGSQVILPRWQGDVDPYSSAYVATTASGNERTEGLLANPSPSTVSRSRFGPDWSRSW